MVAQYSHQKRGLNKMNDLWFCLMSLNYRDEYGCAKSLKCDVIYICVF